MNHFCPVLRGIMHELMQIFREEGFKKISFGKGGGSQTGKFFG